MRNVIFFICTCLIASCATQSGKDSTSTSKEQSEMSYVKATFEEALPEPLGKIMLQSHQLMRNKAYSEAHALLESAELQFSAYPQIYLNRALIAIEQQDLYLAQSFVEIAIQKRPDYAPSYNVKGVLFRMAGSFVESKDAYSRAIELQPNYLSAILNLGILADLYLQDFKLALENFEKFLVYEPENQKVKNWVTELQRRMPKMEASR